MMMQSNHNSLLSFMVAFCIIKGSGTAGLSDDRRGNVDVNIFVRQVTKLSLALSLSCHFK